MRAANLLVLALLAGSPAATPVDSRPWLQDLSKIENAFESKYANWDWAVFERQADMRALFLSAAQNIRAADSNEEAESSIDRMIRRLGDGHVVVDWPNLTADNPTPPEQTTRSAAYCSALGYDREQAGSSVVAKMAGFRPLSGELPPEFPAGTIRVGARLVGVIRIGEFSPKDSPELCENVLRQLAIRPSTPCDESCADRVETEASNLMSAHLAGLLHKLRSIGADVLLLDITDNGGGSEWAEAATRIVTAKPLLSERMGFVRDAHWAAKWKKLASDLRRAAGVETSEYRNQLRVWAGEADEASVEASTPCSSQPFLEGKRPVCSWLGKAGYATGFVRDAQLSDFKDRSWGPLVFSPAEYAYERGAWAGSVIVLVDGETWSAAEEFASELQDSGVATIVGTPTGGAGCGHTGDPPTLLPNSHGILKLPDCARFRADGRNEIAGVDPDVLVGWRQNDGPNRRALRLQATLNTLIGAHSGGR